ncbi:uncharacterized protein LOC129287471 isoform X2 [Prosopis cineraria]|uniref:uncharacterized protein LOC129287471 isoform X2 n=1 Tax=Prosopis cineraria TaxID=364024 RepID=UPI00240F827F|nr:uncharacterized protein LOC129287471 isoform X2 [Prosopis cineraria]
MANTTRRSIELEPKTLNQGQISQARKVAADVVQKMEPKEASSLFTEVEEMMDGDEEKVVEKQVGCMNKIEMMEEKACNNIINLYSPAMVDSPSDHQLHTIHQNEPLSAPF